MYEDEFLSLSLGQWFHELLNSIKDQFSGKSNVRYTVLSGHDTTVAPLLMLLQVGDKEWPPYAANVAIELWRISNEPFVRIVYNGQPSKMKFCSAMFCPLDEFSNRVSKFSLSSEQWKAQCKL
ncbi:hypothetical protein GEMRC1_004673 [Eukaryota sp. GEM-RC1]